MRHWVVRLIWLATMLAAAPSAAVAQNMFAPVAKVNDRVITAYERDQRARMLELFGVQGDPRNEAVTRLIEERLQVQEARRLGLTLTEEEIEAGEVEFAARAELGREEFLQALSQAGVARESLRDFVAAGLLWRKVVRQRFGPPATSVTPRDVERAMALAEPEAGTRLLLSEIVLPADSADSRTTSMLRAAEIRELETPTEFAAAAGQFSISDSRTRGGELEWLAADSLPPPVRSAVLGLEEGEISAPVTQDDRILLFYLRERRDLGPTTPASETLDYAVLLIEGGRGPEALDLAERIAEAVSRCDDLYGIARNADPQALERHSRQVGQVPADIATELADMDPGEISTALTRGDKLVFLMLCQRLANPDNEILMSRVGEAILNQRATGRARVLLADLRANAVVELY